MLRSTAGGRTDMHQDATPSVSNSSMFSQRHAHSCYVKEATSSLSPGEDSPASDQHAPLLERSSSWMADYGSLPPVLHRSDGRATDSQCIFNMVNALLAIGLLGFPFCFKTCGVILTLSITYMAYRISIISTTSLLLAANLCDKRSYEEVAAHCFGFIGRLSVMACLFCLNLGCLVAYVNILADALSSVAGSVIPPGAEPSRHALLLAVCVFAVLPVSMSVRTSDQMAAVSTASIAFIAIFTSVIAILAFSPIPNPQAVAYWNADGLLLSMPMVLYAFTPHTVLFAVYSTMRTAAVRKMQSVVDKSLMGCAVVYVVVGLGGYLAFRQRTAGDVLRNLGGTNVTGLRALYEQALRLGYGLAVLGCIPMVMLPLQHTLLPLILPVAIRLPHCAWLTKPSTKWTPSPRAGQKGATPSTQNSPNVDGMDISSPLAMGLTAGLSVLSLLFAMWLPNVELILGLMGSTAAVVVGMILPGAIILRVAALHKERLESVPAGSASPKICWKWMQRKALVMILVGGLLGIASTRHLLQAVADEAEVVELAQRLHEKETVLLQAAEVEQKARSIVSSTGSAMKAQEAIMQHPDKEISQTSDDGSPTGQHLSQLPGNPVDRHERDKLTVATEEVVQQVVFGGAGRIHENVYSEAALPRVPAGSASATEAAAQSSHQSIHAPLLSSLQTEDKFTAASLQVPFKLTQLNDTALATLAALMERLQEDPVKKPADILSGASGLSNITKQLDLALDTLHRAKQLPNDTQTVNAALSVSMDAIRAVNGSAASFGRTSDVQVLSVVQRVKSVLSLLQFLLHVSSASAEPSVDTDHDSGSEPEGKVLFAAGEDDYGDADRKTDPEAQQYLPSLVMANTTAAMSIAGVAEDVVKAAEEATNAALKDIKSAVGKVDPHIVSRAEEIAQEMTVLEAMDSIAEQDRLKSDKASLGMSIKLAPSNSHANTPRIEATPPAIGHVVSASQYHTPLGRKGGVFLGSAENHDVSAMDDEFHDIYAALITSAPAVHKNGVRTPTHDSEQADR